jgi:hypothetical protein
MARDPDDRTDPHDRATERDAAGAARLRDRIDRGAAGDKVAFSDPAAAPLGTDAEAAGHSPTAEQVRHAEAAEHERANAGAKHDPAERQSPATNGPGMMIAAAAILVGLVLLALWLI